MTAIKLDGSLVASLINQNTAYKVTQLKAASKNPILGVLSIGDNSASNGYYKRHKKDCEKVGISMHYEKLPADATLETTLNILQQLESEATGVIIEQVMPVQFSWEQLINNLHPNKDVEGITPANIGKLIMDIDGHYLGKPVSPQFITEPLLPDVTTYNVPVPCAPRAIIALLDAYGVSLAGKRVTVVGRGPAVGRILTNLLTTRRINATVTTCHTGTTTQLQTKLLLESDVIISATGHENTIRPEQVKPGSLLVDVGMSMNASGQMVGDINSDCAEKADLMVFHKGGIGPVNRAMLLANLVNMV